MIVIGIDPDSEAHGIATYIDGKLVSLGMMTRANLVGWILSQLPEEVVCSIENVMANKFVYARNAQRSKAVETNIALKTGRCQQAQVELMRDLDGIGCRYELHVPQRGNWAGDKKRFETVTGWKGKSNADTRSAAYFGYLALRGRDGVKT